MRIEGELGFIPLRAYPDASNGQNIATEQCIRTLKDISAINTNVITLPRLLTQLQTDFRARNSFPHIQRLHSMLYAYGATLIEIVRRKEFGECQKKIKRNGCDLYIHDRLVFPSAC